MMLLDDYQSLLRKLEKLKARVAEAGGELKGVVAGLKAEGFSSLKEAAEKLPALQDDARKNAEEFTTMKQELETEYRDQLEGL